MVVCNRSCPDRSQSFIWSFQLFDFALIALAISGSLLKIAEYFSQSL
jgi:hypothetical protein